MSSDRMLDSDRTTAIPKLSRYLSVRRAAKENAQQRKQRDSVSGSGQRNVTISCDQFSINVPTTPETTPLDAIKSAAMILTQDLDVSNSILLESCHRLGVERRVRSYELVQDIMNNWDGDQQNTLAIQTSNIFQYYFYDFDLVQRFAPKNLTVFMYHSQYRGDWHKRYITLLSTGQIFTSQNPDAKITDTDIVEICHLSDFDIYTPMLSQASEVLRPPKKICYALKSQRNPNSLSSSPVNDVQLFSTDDAELGMRWFGSIQLWRSWYLLSRLGAGNDGRGVPKSRFPPFNPESVFLSANVGTVDGDPVEEKLTREITFPIQGSMSPPQQDKMNSPSIGSSPPSHTEREAEFAADSLLGRPYTHRQRMGKQKESSGNQHSDQSSITASSGHRNSLYHSQSASSESTGRSKTLVGDPRRSGGQRQKPLVDLTPTFKEAPQWDVRKKGRGVKAPKGVPLVALATGPCYDFGNEVSGTVFRRE